MANLILVGGGARSGKSRFAVHRAEQLGNRRVFIATAEALDQEMQARITRHQQERANRFRTIDCPIRLPETVLAQTDVDVMLIDCLTLWITNLLGHGLSNDDILKEVDRLIESIAKVSAHVIVVSNEVGMGLVSLHELGRRFQDCTGWAHQRLANQASEIYLAALGCVLRLKPEPLLVVSACKGTG
jgi:adenosylcobinamide kinase/adenosylcobinamide-phosphate guanylyltransferase